MQAQMSWKPYKAMHMELMWYSDSSPTAMAFDGEKT